MATYSKKGEDPTEVARSAIQDTPNVRERGIKSILDAAAAAMPPAMEIPDEAFRPGPRATREIPTEMPATGSHRDDRDVVRAANDDRESIGQIMQSLQRRPARTPFVIASLFTALWTIAALALIYGFSEQLGEMSSGAGWTPTAIGLAGAFGAPIVFFYALANMMARLNELRIVSSSMAEATLRFAEPEIVARDAIVTIGQAIRREVAAMGDGVERTLARAAELETLVSQAEQVRNAITNVHLDLSHDITTVSELIAERVNEAAQRVTRALADQGEQITVALGASGGAMIDGLGERGADLLKRLERTSDDTTHAIDAAGDRLTSGLNFKSDHLNEQLLAIATNLQQSLSSRLDEVVDRFSHKSSSVLDAVDIRTRELAETISDRSETVSRALIDTTGRIAETIASRADEVNNSLKTTGESIVLDLSLRGGDMVSKLEDIGNKLTETVVSRSDHIAEHFGSNAETLAASIASRSDMMRDMLAQRLQTFEEIFSRSGAALAERIARDSTQLGDLITHRLAEFDRTVRTHGGELVENLAQRTADIQELVATAVTTRDDVLTVTLCRKIDDANMALATRAAEVADNLESQIGRFEDLLVGRAEAAARDIETRTQAAAEFAVERLAGATEDMETRTVSATDEIALRVRDATLEIGKHTTEAFSQLLERSGNVSQEVETRTQAAADVMQARASELSDLLDKASSGLIAAISSKGGQFATEIEQATESAAKAIDAKAFAFTQSIMNNSNELARIITDASTSATSIVSRTLKELQDSARNSVSQATMTVAQTLKDLQQSTRGAVDQSKQVAMSTVSEIRETHGMLRSDATALFERLRDANGTLQQVLGGAQTNLSAIEQMLSTRVTEFVSTLEQLLDSADATTGKLDRQVSSFYGVTSRVLGDLGELAVQFDGHGKALADAVTLLEKANDDTMASVTERKNAIEDLAAAADNRTEQLDKHLKRFSNLIDVSLRSAEDRARDAARLVAEATSEGARTLAERHAAIRSTTEQQSKQTLQSLHELHERVSSETKDLFQQNAGEAHGMLQQATDRFAEIMQNMKQMSVDMQRELDTTRKELRRGVLELPEETAESMAQMRRVIVDQMEALAELNRIVARHGRAMDTVGAATEQSPVRRGYGNEEPAMAVAAAPEPASRQATPA